jgi:hypothetical protein
MKVRPAGDKRLLVEGATDKYAVACIMRKQVAWSDEAPAVHIKDLGGVDNLLKEGNISNELGAAGLRTLGLMLDANDQLAARYRRVRDESLLRFPLFPEEPPQRPLILDNDDGKRLGLWIMPDNKNSGYLEHFLAGLVPEASRLLWDHAAESANRAKAEFQAPFSEPQIPKARFYTYLAWQKDPGRPPGYALMDEFLDPQSSETAAFVQWFRSLYEL